MKTRMHVLCLIALITSLHSFGQTVSWSKSFGNADSYAFGCSYDSQGNVFYGYHTHASNSNVFFGKYTPSGSFAFSKNVSSGWAYLNDLVVNSSDDVYIVRHTINGSSAVMKHNNTGLSSGYQGFSGTYRGLALTPSEDVITVGDDDGDIEIVKLSGSTTSVLWSKVLPGVSGSSSSAFAVEVDQDGNIYVGGSIDDTVDFNPSTAAADTFYLTNGAYVAKFDSSGNFLWATSSLGYSSSDCYDLDIDNLGNVYLTGRFWSFFGFTSTPTKTITSNSSSDIFFCKLDSSGNVLWLNGYGGSSYDNGYAVEVYDDTTIYFGGNVRYSVNFGTGMDITSQFAEDPFMARADSSGIINRLFHFPTSSQGALRDIRKGNKQIVVSGDHSGMINLDTTRSGFTHNSGQFSFRGFVASFCMEELGQIGQISGTTFICSKDDTASFSIPPVTNATSYTWNLPTGYQILGTADSTSIKVLFSPNAASGAISVTASGLCASPVTSTSHNFQISSGAIPIISSTKSTYCEGETAIVYFTNEEYYDLYVDSVLVTSALQDTFYISNVQSGFQVYAGFQDALGCQYSTSSITINSAPHPQVSINCDASDLEVCAGESVHFTASGANGLSIYRNGAIIGNHASMVDSIVPGDFFYAIGTNNFGCIGYSDTLSISVNPKPNVTLTCSDPDLVITPGQNVTIQAFGGDFYTFYLNGSVAQSSADSIFHLNGVQPMDEVYVNALLDSCESTSRTLYFTTDIGLREDLSSQIELYPVPSNGVLHMKFSTSGDYGITVYTSGGEQVLSEKVTAHNGHVYSYNIRTLPSGLYTIHITSSEGDTTFKLPVTRN